MYVTCNRDFNKITNTLHKKMLSTFTNQGILRWWACQQISLISHGQTQGVSPPVSLIRKLLKCSHLLSPDQHKQDIMAGTAVPICPHVGSVNCIMPEMGTVKECLGGLLRRLIEKMGQSRLEVDTRLFEHFFFKSFYCLNA